MPRFSVIVPAYQVQAYLPECLESVLSQSYADLELIAVDDCSPDACGAVIDEFAARDPRVRAVHLPENTGLGPARNAGMERATGDYLVFLDGDDTLAPDALLAIAGRLEETGDPDVLVYDYARTYWSGETVRNRAAAELTERGPAPFRLTDRPGLLNLLMVAWNKAYRREFTEHAGFVFPPGYYEDTPWTYPVLMTAGSIATLDRVCVHYRQRRAGGILRTASERHFDVFDQYDRVFAYLDEHPGLACWRPVLFRRMVDHLVTVHARRDRLPRGTHAAFLRRARSHYRRHRAPGAPVPARARIHHALIRFGLHRTYRALRLASALRRGAVRLSGRLLGALRSAALLLHYRVQRLLPLRADHAVFTPHGDDGHGGDPGALESAFRAVAPHLRTAWVVRPGHPHAVPPGARPLVPGTAAHWSALARSAYLVGDTGLGPRPVRRKGQVVVRTQDGTPLGHTGLDLLERPAAARDTDFARLLEDVDRWDYVVSASRHSTLVWERAYPGRYTTLEYGRPCTDRFHTATGADVAGLREALGVPEGAVAVLYVPAHRDYRRTQRPLLDLERVARRLGPRFVVLARTRHPLGGPPAGSSGRVLDVTGHPSVTSLCLASDALVTDYSPLMFDYAGLDRPIVLCADDREAYEAARGTYVDLRAFPPGAVAGSEEELIDIFATGHWRGSHSDRRRAAFRARFCPHDDGRAAERVARRVVFGETCLPPVVPLHERRPVPSAAAASEAPPPLATVPQQQPGGPQAVTDRV
ncbi:bifunctional glycosyltransferase family 2 protein/CDP-glycerol:glycerophosphate glycerophosphotransferase [Streptomyces sp. Tu 3180]|uniref:bifunctional glycosyltransferase/CDP-glycerol:glycerophosphate glycerophosphotransferase n=1 Tax=Streptomyces sp. Tu 3180 TaxID=2682611 RepID=UPI00135809D7|nr:bifunctional glycosyltransferase family 2 protein/CDP-glycerol:glycerophosphate glycerophosphotransferase [Streptomyces sp. Tu 3180]KAF3465725.1 bifunctional glycosyltransferase family 2 protein/CDP-glycerol:glycerophosphate glycerophosphotransferase [Streptomyces sp. Tu 3180]